MEKGGDELESLFMSNNSEDILRFYDNFSSIEELLNWMKNRPPAPIKVIEIECENTFPGIVVIVPTANVESTMARYCRDVVFKGFRLVFVESSGQYFNGSRSAISGLKYIVRYNPKWIIISSDDVISADAPAVLAEELSRKDHTRFDTVFTRPMGFYHSFPGTFGREYHLGQLFRNLAQYHNIDGYRILKKFHAHSWLHIADFKTLYSHNNRGFAEGTDGSTHPVMRFVLKFYNYLLRQKFDLIEFRSLFIISGEFIRELDDILSDTTYINAGGDIDLSIHLAKRNRMDSINYAIKFRVGASLGASRARKLRDLAGDIYLDYKLKNGLL